VASSDPAAFLPTRRVAGRQDPLGRPTLLDALDLGRGRWLLVLEASPGLLAYGVVEDRHGFRRARAGDGVSEELLARLARGETSRVFSFRTLGPVEPWIGERPIEVDQSDESIVVAGMAVVKRSVLTTPGNELASLVRSLDHVGRVEERRRRGSAAGWIQDASDAGVRAYRGELAAHGASTLFDERLLRPLRVAQELDELVYAARYLPEWRYDPDLALPALLEEAT